MHALEHKLKVHELKCKEHHLTIEQVARSELEVEVSHKKQLEVEVSHKEQLASNHLEAQRREIDLSVVVEKLQREVTLFKGNATTIRQETAKRRWKRRSFRLSFLKGWRRVLLRWSKRLRGMRNSNSSLHFGADRPWWASSRGCPRTSLRSISSSPWTISRPWRVSWRSRLGSQRWRKWLKMRVQRAEQLLRGSHSTLFA